MNIFLVRLLLLGMIACGGLFPQLEIQASQSGTPVPSQPERRIDTRLVLDTLSAWVDSQIAGMANALAVAAMSHDVQALNWERMKPLLSAIAERFGPAVVWYAQPDGAYFTVDAGLTDKNLKDRAYFPKVLAGETAIGELVISKSTGRNTVIVAIPIMNQGKVVGILGASIYLDQLAEKMHNITTLPTEVVFYALDTQGRIALHTQQGFIFQEAMNLGSPSLTAAITHMLANPEGVVNYAFAGGQQQAVFRTSPLTGWKYALRYPAQ